MSLLAIIAAGILSRVAHTGFAVFDKYLGDALYAAMIYVILRIVLGPRPWIPASLIMVALELFQLTMIPARMVASDRLLLRAAGVLIGTQFSVLDLLAYAFGIGCLYLIDKRS